MRKFKIILSISIMLLPLLGDAQTSNWNWAISLNGPTNEDEIDAVASDMDGNVYVSGKFEDTLYIAGSPTPMISKGKANIMLVKYDSLGVFQWAKKFGGIGEDNVFDAACTSSGDSRVLSGYFQNTLKLDTFSITSLGGTDAFLAKLDENGSVIWVLQYGGGNDDGGNEVAIANNGQIIVGAQSIGNISIGLFNFTNINPGIDDAYIISVNPNGSVAWARTISGAGTARAKSIAVDNSGNVYLGGDFIGQNSVIDELGNASKLISNGARDAYITSWNSIGNLRWYKDWGGLGNELCKGVTTNDNLDLYLSGPFTDNVSFEGESLTPAGPQDFYLWKLSSSGIPIWLRHISSIGNIQEGGEIESDGYGGVITGIGITNTLKLQDSWGFKQYTIPTLGTSYPFFIQYNQDGNIVFTKFSDNNASGHGTFGEISRSGNLVFLDVILRGNLTFNNTISSGKITNKDAGLVNISLPKLLTSGIENSASLASDIIIYPNPTNGIINIDLPDDVHGFQIYIYNSLGQKCFSNHTNSNQIDLGDLDKGLYFIQVKTIERIFSRKLLIKE